MECVRNQEVLQEDEYKLMAAKGERERKRAYHRLSFLRESFGEGLLDTLDDDLHPGWRNCMQIKGKGREGSECR